MDLNNRIMKNHPPFPSWSGYLVQVVQGQDAAAGVRMWVLKTEEWRQALVTAVLHQATQLLEVNLAITGVANHTQVNVMQLDGKERGHNEAN